MSAVDTLKTILTLEQNVSVPAKAAAEAVEELGQEAVQAERRIDELGDEMFQVAGITKAFGDSFREAGGSPFTGLINAASGAGKTLGQALAPAIGAVSAFLAGPGGLVVAAVAAGAAVASLGFGMGFVIEGAIQLTSAISGVAPVLHQAFGIGVALPLLDRIKEYDSYIRVLRAVYDGDREKAAQTAKFVQDYGLKSDFSQAPLRETTKTLLQGGYDPNEYLPVMETFALFGGKGEESMQRVNEIIRRLMGGQITEALGSEGLGSLGINRQMLEGAGARYTKQGAFIGGQDEAMQVLKNLATANSTMRAIREEMLGSVSSVVSNFWDAVDKNINTVIETISKYALPMIENLTQGLIRMANSDAPKVLGEALASLFGYKDGLKTTFNEIAASFLSMIETGVTLARNSLSAIGAFFTSLENTLNKWMPAIMLISPTLAMGIDQGRQAFRDAITSANSAFGGGMSIGDRFNANKDKYAAILEKATIGDGDTKAALPVKGNTILDAEKARMEVQMEANRHLQSIRENTNRANEIAIQRMILGGGEMGSFGVTPHRVAVAQGRSTGGPVERAIRGLADAIAEDQALRLMSYDNAIQGRA